MEEQQIIENAIIGGFSNAINGEDFLINDTNGTYLILGNIDAISTTPIKFFFVDEENTSYSSILSGTINEFIYSTYIQGIININKPSILRLKTNGTNCTINAHNTQISIIKIK